MLFRGSIMSNRASPVAGSKMNPVMVPTVG